MKISYNWLKEFIDLELSAEETAEKLTLIGLEVEEVTAFGSLLEGVIVGEIVEVKDHPNADRLRICRVNLGDETVQIICGADNVAVGKKVPVATIGATLPAPDANSEPFTIRKAKLLGEPSCGMICAEDELGLGSDHSGIMVLDEKLTAGTALNEAIDLYRDFIIDIELTPNRPDAASHLGVARDLGAALNLELKKPFKSDFEAVDPLKDIHIEIKNSAKCPRYVGKVVEGITIKESPAWLKNRLKALGLRPVNNVVDVTNYVMYEMGQPLHAFDKKRVRGNRIIVQDFDKEIEFETLDHVNRKCPAGTLFICDGEGPVAIAGVMGGVDSEVSKDTTEVLIESACFEPGTIRKTAKEQALQTDASYRFERGVDPRLQRIAAERAASLIAKVAEGTVRKGCSDVHPVHHQPRQITLRKSYTNRLLGTRFSVDEINALLHGLGLIIQEQDQETICYTIPSYRPDLEREVDLIEEVGRLFDYNNIPKPEHGRFISPEPINRWEQLNIKIKQLAKGLQFREIYSNSLISEADAMHLSQPEEMLHTLNPISAEMTTLRPSLLHGFLKSAAYNFNRNASQVRFFETGHVFSKSENGTYYKGIHEESNILFGIAGLKTVEHWNTEPAEYSVYDLKAAIDNFLISLDLREHTLVKSDTNDRLAYFINDTKIGELYTVDQSLKKAFELKVPVFAAEFSITKIDKQRHELPAPSYEPVAKFPAFDFDFGVIVDADLQAQTLLQQIKQTAGDQLNDILVFDIFEGKSIGEDKKSIAFRLSFLNKNKTLTIKDVEPIIENILNVLDEKYAAQLRNY